MTIQKAIQSFLIEQEVKGNTEKTRDNYKTYLGYFENYIGKDTKVSELDAKHLNEYSISLKNGKRSQATIQTYIRHTRAFIGWLENEGYIKE